ncbi:calcium-activated chloride channel regulator 1-like [Amphibalanus amphitrite]|uniref:calcium-activated chloride channel regulator 1-like n=1 Tax=Amphibalanus amphitrite TaxID=1232801 RepID=UPI001C90CBF7|nr:calcium-activated chloride channel regulator 1-like [Amphibalanus amphitrite]
MTRCSVGALAALAVAAGLLAAASAEVTITDNGYSGLVVGISKDVPEDDGPQLIEAIKAMFREASPALFTATEQRAYFKKVTILIPMTWTNTSIDRVANSEVYEESEVRVAPPNPAYGDNPYTLQPGGCGEPGEYIHVTPDYLRFINDTMKRRFGPAGKVVTHEWAHLRYGVFEEYGYPGDPAYPLFYYSIQENGEPLLVPNFCSNTTLRGYTYNQKTGGGDCTFDDSTGLPDSDCWFYPYDDNDAVTSLMSFTYLNSVSHFCDGSEEKHHHADAPNKHNVRCNQRSVWDVIADNDDFAGGANPPADLTPTQIEPSFEVVQQADARYVLVLDTSGSMSPSSGQPYDRISMLHNAATKWIKYELQNGTWVSIITFTTVGELKTDFIRIEDDASRERLASFVPTTATGGTCICNGVDLALKTLNAALEGPGGIIVLMTDGEENTNCKNPDTGKTWDLTDLFEPVEEADVRVITMAFGTRADENLEKFAEISDGLTYFIDDTKAALDLDQAFQGCLTYQPDITVETEKDIVLFQQHFGASAVKSFSSMFSIDPTTGRDVVFKIEFAEASTQQDITSVELESPTGQIVDNITYPTGENFGTIELDMAEKGDWSFTVTFKRASVDMVITTTSKARSHDVLPLTVECWIGSTGQVTVDKNTRLSVLGKVRQGQNAVLQATVMAHVTTPDANSPVVDMQLLDSGVGADAIRDDGIYTKYFTQFNNKGRYSVVCEVRNDGNAVINEGFSASGAMPNPKNSDSSWCCGSTSPVGNTRPTGNFTRTVSAGAFQILNTPQKGILPPGQVTDLVLQQRSRSKNTATVQWTAPGADLDQGTATEYEFRWSNVSSDLSPSQFLTKGVLVNATLVPAPETSGTIQTLTIDVPKGLEASSFFMAMRTRDDQADNWSAVSNTAILYMGAVPAPPDDGLSPGAIAGIVIGVLVVVVAVVVAGVFVNNRRRMRVDGA